MSDIEAVIFDWGGTLTPWHSVDAGGQWRAYAQAAFPAQAAEAERAARALLEAEAAAWVACRDEHTSTTFDQVLASVGLDRHAEAYLAYQDFWHPHTYLDPDVPGLFRALKERGIRVGVLSNTIWDRAWHEAIFERDGILGAIDGAVYTSEIAVTKPHPEAFRAAMAAVGVHDPAACVFVGDRPFDDITGARRVGMRAVLVPHSDLPLVQQVPTDVHPDAVVQRLAEVLEHVDRWRGR